MKRELAIAGVLFLTVAAWCMAVAISNDTLTDRRLPFVIAGCIALVTGPLVLKIWQRITGCGSKPVNYLCNAVASTGLIAALLLMLNFSFADPATGREESVTIERRYYKVRHHIKRLTRRTYAQGEAYNVYYMEIRFAGGMRRDIAIPLSQYRRIKAGQTTDVRVERGLFNIPVIKRR